MSSTMPKTLLLWVLLSARLTAAFGQTGTASPQLSAEPGRWTPERAWAWYEAQPWLVGCNFMPSTAVNDVEMWQKETFDARTIERELTWAQHLGFNTVRVFVNYVVWEADATGLKRTFRDFLKRAHRHGLRTLVILLDDCFKPEPRVGVQEPPEPGVHNSQWVQSPGVTRRTDPAAWPQLEAYIKDMVSTFGNDHRVLAWELYNEPSPSLALVEAAFRWARACQPSQPITTTIYGNAEMQNRIIALSDVLCFHEYGPLRAVEGQLARLRAHDRPVLCTEWMARGPGSRFETHLPFFKAEKVACWSWGLVAGRTQTYYPWGSPRGAPEPLLWHHDIFRADGTPFSAPEVVLIRVTTGRLPASALLTLPQRQEVVPTAEAAPLPWRYTLEPPAENWCKPSFNDAGWNTGSAPFGTVEPPFGRKPNTIWTSADIWLRRLIELPSGPFADLGLRLHHDEDTEVYINGVLAAKAGGYNSTYEPLQLAPEAQAFLKPGTNLLAVHCHQTTGGQYFDLGIDGVGGAPRGGASAEESTCHQWKTVALRNQLIEVQVAPDIGGRVIEYRLGAKNSLWVNPNLQGLSSPQTGLGPDGSWLNYGGDKLWPAPQGWDNDCQWPGPPDAVLDGQPYALEKLRSRRGEAAVRLTSRKDPRSGIQFSRVIRLFEGSTRVSFTATMKNVDTKPRRWGIWAHTQLDATRADGTTYNPLLKAWCPLHPQSHFPNGYCLLFGAPDNPSFQPGPLPGLMRVHYHYQVGKIGLDSPAGWVATVDGESGAVFVQRFAFEPGKPYPDGASVEFWLNGLGKIHAYNREMVMSTNRVENRFVFESELLSPYASLKPGQSYSWYYEWYACQVGGDYPVLRCSDAGVVAEPLTIRRAESGFRIQGRFGVFALASLRARFRDGHGKTLRHVDWEQTALPTEALVLNRPLQAPEGTDSVQIVLIGKQGQVLGELAEATFPRPLR